MNKIWILYTSILIVYIILLVVYFLRRTKRHESELTNFLKTAKQQIDLHREEASKQANVKVVKAAAIVKKVQEATEAFEEKAQQEYEQIVADAKEERRELLASARQEIDELFEQAETELEAYRQDRQKEIERNMVKLVISVTEKVVELSLSERDHKQLIEEALEEIKANKARS